MNEFTVDPDVMKKVKKLLALGQSDNVHEAALAIARAQQLMERHRISQAMLDISGSVDEEKPTNDGEPLYQNRKMDLWRQRLAVIISTANGCFVWKERATAGSPPKINIIGKASNVAKARYLFQYCLNEVLRLVNVEAKGKPYAYRNNFRIGCVDAIRDAIERERQALREEMLRNSVDANQHALVVRSMALVDADAANARAALNLSFGKARRVHYTNDNGARAHGQRAGSSIYPGGNAGSITSGARRLGPGRPS